MRRSATRPSLPATVRIGTAVATALLILVTLRTPLAAAQNTATGEGASGAIAIELISASPWVEPDGDWTARLRVTSAPSDAQLSYSIRQPVDGTEVERRQELESQRQGKNETRLLQRQVSAPLASATDSTGVSRLDIAVRSTRSGSRDRVLVPASGVYPVVVSVQGSDRTELASLTLYLNRLPSTEEARDPFRLAVILDPPQESGFDDRGEPLVPDSLRSTISTMTDLLTVARGLPIGVVVRPQSLVALTQSGLEPDVATVERLRESLGSATVLRAPWAQLHLEGWATSGSLGDVQTSLLDGQEALFARLLVPVEARVWPVDPTAGPGSVPLWNRLGVPEVLVTPDRLVSAKSPAGESGFSRPFRLAGDGDASVTAMAVDPDLQALALNETPTPTLAAHQMTALMFATWLTDDRPRGAVLELDDLTQTSVVEDLLSTLADNVPRVDRSAGIEVSTPAALASLPVITVRQAGREVEWTRALQPAAETPRVTAVSRNLARVRPLVDDYAAMLGNDDSEARRLAVIVQRSLDRRLAPTGQAQALADVETLIASDFRKISASDPRTLRLTSRRTSIPLRFTNDTGRPVKVRLKMKSPRLDFVDGDEQDLTLNPGLNRLNVEVDVRASGQFVMQADLVAPATERVLASTRQRIRSTTFSGVGLMLSGGALLFLVVWWSRTLRRKPRPPADSTDGEAVTA